ncbi:glycosyltransferase [Pusillimonas sp. SM2304]|uniref:glycosyltransferase n=1 Tax=Pusillimonas sp. SM2304 TaxID=3073241 RepID=UPI0028770070|nr:glycosyltransferase [Pusillimonas sp. SM2304]MDS1142004.1 glycosyltransferase [Pusillimonas sp. SM2304]
MKLLAVTYGTEGDTRPLAVLCRALKEAGHDVMLLAGGQTLDSAAASGVRTAALKGNIRDQLESLVSGGKGVGATAAGLARMANAHTEDWMRQLAEHARDCDALLVSGLAAFAGLSVAEHFNIRAIGAGLIPISPTRAFPSPFLPAARIPQAFNRLSHHMVNGLVWRAFRKATNQARRRVLALPSRRRLWSDHPMLYGVSPCLLPQPRDWPAHTRLCGQWTGPLRPWTPPSGLQDFLDAGEAPIYIGFGSMVGFDRETVLRTMLDAAAGRRVLLYPGWAGLPDGVLPDNVYVLGDTPHDWLFPRTSLVIHHGGSGTAHSACRAGVPSVVVPFAGDQAFWAHQLRRLGVAATPLKAKGLSQAGLESAIAFAQRAETRQRAQALGRQMAKDAGTATAVAEIEAIARLG